MDYGYFLLMENEERINKEKTLKKEMIIPLITDIMVEIIIVIMATTVVIIMEDTGMENIKVVIHTEEIKMI